MKPNDKRLMAAIANDKLIGAMNDPYASELARRLSVAWIADQHGDSFTTVYRRHAPSRTGEFWLVLAVVALEDKRYGEGRPDSIRHHPMMEAYPDLDVDDCRRDSFVVKVAREYQAAYATMGKFIEAPKPSAGYTSFRRHLQRIDQPDDVWIVLAKLTMTLSGASLSELLAPDQKRAISPIGVVN